MIGNTATATQKFKCKLWNYIFLIGSFSTDFLPVVSLVEKFSTNTGNTGRFSTTSTSKTVLGKHLSKIFLGGDEKDLLVYS